MKEDPEIARLRDNIRKEIAMAGYRTIELFAHEHGIDKSTLSRVINGQREPRVGTIVRIARALDIRISRLFGESELLQTVERPESSYRRR